MRRSLVLVSLCLASACGGGTSGTATLGAPGPAASSTAPKAVVFPRDEPIPTYTPTPPTASTVHFATPEAAMTYLADAWNRNDLKALKHVTDPAARDELQGMHDEAIDLTLDHCTFSKGRGDYECYFTHGFPKGYQHQSPIGTAEFTVGPATRPGWYMTYFVDCGG